MTFPALLNAALPQGSDSPSRGDDELRGIKRFIQDVFGVLDSTQYNAAAFAISPVGVVTFAQPGMVGQTMVMNQGTITAAVPVIDATTSWSQSATTFSGWRLNVTDLGSTSTSLLLDLRVGNTTVFGVTKTGALAQTLSSTFVGPHSIGVSPDPLVQWKLGGNAAANDAIGVVSTLNPLVNASSYGLHMTPAIVVAASGTHADFASAFFEPMTIIAGTAVLTNASTLKIAGEPSSAANNYALWVAGGKTRFDGFVATGGVASSLFKVDFGTGVDAFVSTATGTQSAGYVVLRPLSIANTSGTGNIAAMFAGTSLLKPTGASLIGATICVDPPTKAGAGTFDHMASMYISNAPSGGTHNYAQYIAGGRVRWDAAGPHSIGGQESATNAFYLHGIYAGQNGLVNEYRVQPTAGADGALYLGSSSGTIDKAASGTHGVFAAMYLQPHTVTANAGSTLTTNTTLYISGMTNGGSNNYGLFVNNSTTKLLQNDNTLSNLILDTSHTRGAALQFLQNGTGRGYLAVDGFWQGNTSSDLALIQSGTGGLRFYTNGSTTAQAIMAAGGGLQLGAPTGGDKGVGTLNVSSGYYVNGALVTPAFTKEYISADTAFTIGSGLGFVHGLGVAPKLIQVTLKNLNPELGYSAGDEVLAGGINVEVNAAQAVTVVMIAAGTQINVLTISNVYVSRFDTGVATLITAANWRLKVRAWA